MSSDTDTQRLLGEIKGIVEGLRDGQVATNVRLDRMDDRLRVVEQRAAAVGAVSGGVMAVGIALITETLKGWIGKGTPHP